MAGFGRVITAMVTPMDRTLAVDYGRAAALAKRLVERGSDGLVVCGTTGESPTLTDEEKVRLFHTVREAVGKRAAVIAGTGTYNTAHSIHLTKEAERAGCDGVLLVNPYYNKPSQEGLYQHFKAVAESTRLAVMLYNIQGRTSVNCEPATVARLAQVPNIVAIKEASGSLDQMSQIRKVTPPEFLLYSGDDSLTLPLLAVGGHGVVSVASHLAGREIREMIEAFVAGDVLRATAMHLRLWPLFKVLFITTNPVPVKAALALAGFDAGGLRLPLVEATPKEREQIAAVIKDLALTAVAA
ncbi:MAG TPA: 4-hydroxy-tetrahydrodipicolinate synthase [bacterium]|nr:4-hydroxy-tetrahydrodipicolinate synthase [bacterium]